MSTAEKRLAQMRTNPKGDWRIGDLETVAIAYSMKVRKSGRQPRCVFTHDGNAASDGAARRPIKPVYIRQFV